MPEHDALVLEFLDGEVMAAEKLRRGDRLPSSREPAAGCTGARASCRDFDMFDIQRGYVDVVQERGFRLPERYLEFEPQVRALEEAMRVRAEPTRAVQQRPARGELHRVDGELRLIDYEYSGNNEPSFELGNMWSESNLSLDAARASW